MKIAVEGCCHGELDKIYETIAFLEKKENVKVDLLLCCGDFQAVRNPSDLRCMAVPPKYQKMNTFYKYYSGEKKAPLLTIFIGGNHEASNYLQELPYGGWVAPNIYYLGYAGVLQIGGVRIGGLSGIFKSRDYIKGRYEHVPYTEDTKRSVYHVRNLDVFRLKQIHRHVDIFMSHDWPLGVYRHGNHQQLARFKPYFAEEMEAGTLGSPPAAELLEHIQPSYWFSAHLHAKFAAIVPHETNDGSVKQTRFLALDKCLPRRRFLQLLDIPHDQNVPLKLQLDPEWLNILKSTNHLLKTTVSPVFLPGPSGSERFDFTVSDEEITDIKEDFGGDLTIPENFEPMAETYHHSMGPPNASKAPAAHIFINPQTTLLCEMLDITDPITHFTKEKPVLNLDTSHMTATDLGSSTSNPDEIQLDEDDAGHSSEEESSAINEDVSFDTFVVSRDASALSVSESRLNDSSHDEKYVTAMQSLSEVSQEEEEGEGANLRAGGLQGTQCNLGEMSESLSQGETSPPRGMLSPPSTSGEELVGSSSDKDSSAFLSPVLRSEHISPKRPFEEELTVEKDLSDAVATASPAAADSTSADLKPKKFKRRNQSFYSATD